MRYLLLFLFVLLLFSCTATITEIDVYIDLPNLTNENYFDPAYKEAWQNLKNGEYKLAMENFQKSTIENDKLFVGYGYVFLYQNKFNFALDNFNKTLEIDSDNILAGIGKGIVYEQIKNEKKAFEIYSNLLIKFPDNIQIRKRYEKLKKLKTKEFLSLADISLQQDKDKYVEYLENVLYYSPDLMEIKLKIAGYYELYKDNEKAVKYYELLISQSPGNVIILNKIGALYEKIDRIDEAIIVYKKILTINPEDISISNKINDLKVKFFDNKLPRKFKDIFFKSELNKEDLAALIGFYFKDYLNIEGKKIKIITDIGKSYARKEIINVCTLGIMKVRPDHRFIRRSIIKRADYANIITLLINYLKNSEYTLILKPINIENIIVPIDISPIHKDYKLIKRLLDSNIITLDKEKRFNQGENINPADAFSSLKKILNSIIEKD